MHPHRPDRRTLAQQAVDSIEDFDGPHRGFRRAHAKGACFTAMFVPNGSAATLTTAAHLQHQEVPAVVRFSGSNPDPNMADLLSPAKGMAVQFQLPDQSRTNIVAATIPVFFARTPESFTDIMKTAAALKHKELSVPEKIKAVFEHFSESKNAFFQLGKLKPPVSYATSRYYSIHAYYFVNDKGDRQPVKYEWEPELGTQTLSPEEASFQPSDYLEEDLIKRTAQGRIGFKLYIVLGDASDPTDDPTELWPDDRERLEVGTLYITDPIAEPKDLIMDPTLLTSGIELSDDPILNFRHEAYAISHHRRSMDE
ncbi:catalase family peroxidase [Paenibacillus sp. YPG26]|uniref:catalase family peroxidase n=1 Tax=Paenibacillus sp. YPG26 TaxID=2878915 RepID=UPI00203FF4D2|nr:catalase family peroxidase [Paenibacillus sp. YPG26]USB31857.1 catalase family peroxidase [Paenibacillus sp. YPG26]